MKTLFTIAVLLSLNATAQNKVYSDLPNDITATNSPPPQTVKTFFWGNTIDYAVYQFSNVLMASVNNKKQLQQAEMERAQSMSKLSMIHKQYESYSDFPDKITDGWHSVIATDNMNFCKDAKVLVKDNRVEKFVIDNYLPVSCLSTGTIKKGKNIVTLKNYNGEQLNIIELFFLYDIEQQHIVPAPIRPACVCFWTDLERYTDVILKLDNKLTEKFTMRFDTPPTQPSEGMVCRLLNPGIHSLYGLGRGTLKWEDSFEAKEGKLLMYRIGKN
jgi:hypothetical protein